MQEKIREDIIEWLRFLKNSIGFDGWRFDFVRGYNGQYCKIYTDATVCAAAASAEAEIPGCRNAADAASGTFNVLLLALRAPKLEPTWQEEFAASPACTT